MADQQLNIKLNVIDNATKAFTGVKNSIFNLRNALIGLGGGVALRGLAKIGSEAELTENKLSFLFGSVEKGSQAFKTLNSFASQSPFAFQDIISSAGNLAIVSKDSEQLARNLQIVGNVSAITGLDFQTSAEQISKSFTKGINSARLFQDKGVASLLGFSKGADVSASATEEAFVKVFGTGGRFSQASNVLSNTFQGTLTKITNSFVKFQNDINKGGFFNFISSGLAVINDNLDKNSATLQKFATTFGEELTRAIKGLLLGTGLIIDAVAPIFKFVASGIEGLLKALDALPSGVRELGVIGFLLLGTGGKLIALALGSLLNQQRKFVEQFGDQKFFLEKNTSELNKQSGAYGVIKDFLDQIDEKTKDINEKNQQKNSLINNANLGLEKQKGLLEKIKELLDTLNKDSLKKISDVSTFIAETLNKAITDLAEGLAKSIILGEKLQNVFRSFLQNILIKILSTLIETIARRSLEIILSQTGLEIERQKIGYIQQQNSALLSQIGYQTALNGLRGSGGGGGGGGLGTVLQIASLFFAEGGGIQAGQPAIVGERGREMFIPSTNGTIVPTPDLNGMGTVVNINVSAVDVRGVEQLFLNNRATITNIVNQALNSRGKSNLV
jgi:hypothetical protein